MLTYLVAVLIVIIIILLVPDIGGVYEGDSRFLIAAELEAMYLYVGPWSWRGRECVLLLAADESEVLTFRLSPITNSVIFEKGGNGVWPEHVTYSYCRANKQLTFWDNDTLLAKLHKNYELSGAQT